MSLVHRSGERGLTLVELIAVVAILVVLAGLLLPRIDSLQTKAAKGAAASNMHALASNIMLYKASHNSYPNPWDSLLDDTGNALWRAPDASGPGLEPQLTGGYSGTTGGGFPTKLTTFTLTQLAVDSLSRTGITEVHDLGTTTGLPGNAYVDGDPRGLVVGGKIAVINEDPLSDGQPIWEGLFPGKTTTEITALKGQGVLAAFGVGPSCSINSDTALNVVEYPNLNRDAFYNRYLAVFYVRTDKAKRSFLRAVVGADGDLIEEERADFFEVGDGTE